MIAFEIRRLVAKCLGRPVQTIDDRQSFADDLEADSLDCLSIQMAVEERFELDLHDGEAEACASVGHVVALVEAKLLAVEETA